MLAFTYLGLIIFILFIEVIRKKETSFDFLSLFSLVFTLCYPLPAFLLSVGLGTSELMIAGKVYNGDLPTTVAIFLGYLVVVIGFSSSSAIALGKNIHIQPRTEQVLILLAIVLLLVGCGSIQIYSQQYGGLSVALSKTILIRSSAASVGESGNLLFFKHLMFFTYFSSYLLGGFVFNKKILRGNLLIYFLLFNTFIASVVISFIASILGSSRASLIYYLVGFYLVYILKSKKIFSVATIPILIGIALFLVYGKTFFFSLTALPDGLDAVVARFVKSINSPASSSSEGFNFYQFLANFSFPLYSLETSLNTNYQPRLFIDLINGFLSLIPERVFNIDKAPNISYYNTLYLAQTDAYEIPAGFLAFGIYSMSWLGLVIVCFIYGWVGRYLQTIFNSYMYSINWMPFLYVLTAQVWIDFQPSGDPQIFIQSYFWYLISIILLLLLGIKVSFISSSKLAKA